MISKPFLRGRPAVRRARSEALKGPEKPMSPNQPAAPTIEVVNLNWGATSLSAIRGVLESVYAVLTEAFAKTPSHSIRVLRWSQSHPMLVHDARPYCVYLATGDTYWCQYSLQFSHELCHILTNSDSGKEHKHKWFEETLCELASLFVLHQLAESWVANPPPSVRAAADFAPNHGIYAEERERKFGLPPGRAFPEWLNAQLAGLEADPCDRQRNGTLAVALLPEFRRNPALWRDCGVLNAWDASRNRDFGEYLDSWTACLRERGLPDRTPEFLRRRFGLGFAYG